MTSLLLSLVAGLTVQQAAPPASAAAQAAIDLNIPEVAGTQAAPDCGGRPAVAAQAFCVTTTQAAMEGVADQYNAAFTAQGWMAAAGDDNRIVYVRRRDGGGCTAFQLLAFADDARPAAPEAPGYFAFATIPGDVCAAQPGAPAASPAPVTPPAQ